MLLSIKKLYPIILFLALLSEVHCQEIDPKRLLNAQSVSIITFDENGNIIAKSGPVECDLYIVTDIEGIIWLLANTTSSFIPTSEAKLEQDEDEIGEFISISCKAKEFTVNTESEDIKNNGDVDISLVFYLSEMIFEFKIIKLIEQDSYEVIQVRSFFGVYEKLQKETIFRSYNFV